LYLIVGGIAWMFWTFKKKGSQSQTKGAGAPAPAPAPSVRFEVSAGPSSSSAKPKGHPVPTNWIPPGQSVTVAGVVIPAGMIYVGSTLISSDGGLEPAQLDPRLPVDHQAVDPAERLFGYWPRYDSISPQARRAYLTWLAGGRCDVNANIGYVFLFYYGLERRILVDAVNDASAKAEIPRIVAEIERLQAIYGNASFQRYSSELLGFLESKTTEGQLYLKAAPPASHSRGIPLRMRLGLGQSAVDNQPISADWALAWVRSDPNVHLATVATRCPKLFDAQFCLHYEKQFGSGLRLAVNRTKLKISYRPASAGLTHSFASSLGELPDITTVVTPVKKLQGVVDETVAALEPYSRFIGRHADQAQSLEATLLLPQALWSEAIRRTVDALNERIGGGMVVIKVGELVTAFGGSASPTRERLKSLFQLLQDQGVGVEPDVLAGARVPKSDDSIVLFRLAEDAAGNRPPSGYEAVAIMLDLAITLANADGKISGREVQFLNRQVDAWSHVGAGAQKRLRARLRLGIVYPPTLASLKSRIEPLPESAKGALAKLLSALALADGKLSPAAVKHLEKIYQALGLEPSALYSELHVASAAADAKPALAAKAPQPGRPASPTSSTSSVMAGTTSPKSVKAVGGFTLDATKIALLQVETERVTELLSKVFAAQEPEAPIEVPPPEIIGEPSAKERTPRLLGLDAEHSAFLRVLLTQSSWSRAELADISADMELMLDGALERVNEAVLDAFDNRIAEGDDPIEIAQDLLENVAA
jgi:uncharacterized tellurite resistance protein B-like protein